LSSAARVVEQVTARRASAVKDATIDFIVSSWRKVEPARS